MPSAEFPDWQWKVNGSNYDHVANRLSNWRLMPYGRNRPAELSWTIPGGALVGPDPFSGKSIKLYHDIGAGDVLVFSGTCDEGPAISWGFGGWQRAYVARDLRAQGDHVPVTDPELGIDRIGFNLDSDDPDWRGNRDGLSVGEIIAYILTARETAAALDALGIGDYTVSGDGLTYTLPTATQDDLDTLTVVPPHPVWIAGERVLSAVEALLQNVSPNTILWVKPDGLLRFISTLGRTPEVVRLDNPASANPVDLMGLALTRSTGDCYTRVIVRGQPDATPAMFSLYDGTLEPYFQWGDYETSAEAAAYWSIADFAVSNSVEGYCYCASTTEVYVDPYNPDVVWDADYWDQSTDGRKGTLTLVDPVTTGIDQLFTVKVEGNGSLAGSDAYSLIVADRPLPATSFKRFVLVGTAGEASDVYREYRPTDPYQRDALLTRFPFPVALRSSDGSAATVTSFPTATVLWSSNRRGPYFAAACGMDVDTDAGRFLLHKPSVSFFGNQSNLQTVGGLKAENVPVDVQVWAPINRGNLQAISPADVDGDPQYSGTGYTEDGIERTLTITVNAWIDGGNTSRMAAYAADVLASVQDVEVVGVVPLVGYAASYAVDATKAVEITASYATPWDDLTLPVVEVVVEFDDTSAEKYRTLLHVSTRRASYGADLYTRAPALGYELGGGLAGLGTLGGVSTSPIYGGVAPGSAMGTEAPSPVGYLNGNLAAIRQAGGQFLGSAMGARDTLLGNATGARDALLGKATGARDALLGGAMGARDALLSAAGGHPMGPMLGRSGGPTHAQRVAARKAPSNFDAFGQRAKAEMSRMPPPAPRRSRPLMPGSAGLGGPMDSPFASQSINTSQVPTAPPRRQGGLMPGSAGLGASYDLPFED
jgi:hypothetical protein